MKMNPMIGTQTFYDCVPGSNRATLSMFSGKFNYAEHLLYFFDPMKATKSDVSDTHFGPLGLRYQSSEELLFL